jgi:hypothetical protein
MIREHADFLAFAGCRTIEGPLQVAFSTDVYNLDPLINLTKITGSDEAGNSIYIYKNANLQNILGLKGLNCQLKGGLVVDDNENLISLDGLEGVTRIGQNVASDGIYVCSNPALENVNALKGLAGPPLGQLRMWGNPMLDDQARNSWHDMDIHYDNYEDRQQAPDARFHAH